MRIALRNHEEVAHFWAHQRQPEGRASRVFFDGDTVYSYGRHFAIAKHYDGAVLFTTRKHSVSTAKHCSIVRNAIPEGVRVIRVPYVEDARYHHAQNVAHFREEIARNMEAARRARKEFNRGWRLNEAERVMQEHNAYIAAFGLPDDPIAAETLEDVVEERRAVWAAAKAEQERREALQRQAAREAVARWKAGENVRVPYIGRDTFLRVAGEEIETSRGARIPTSHARKFWRVIKALKERGETYHHNGHSIHLGEYRVDAIDAEGNLTAGCHYIAWGEIARVARDLGLIRA